MTLRQGEVAPDARVAVRPREWVQLSEWFGDRPAVLLFFPLAFSSTCTAELCAVAEDWSAWSDLGANVVAISVDSPYVNVKFAEETKAPFPIVSDFNREATRAYHVLRADLGGLLDVSERVVFVVDRNRRISYVWQGEHPGVFPPLETVKEAVRQAS
jgi:peroxiredoxin